MMHKWIVPVYMYWQLMENRSVHGVTAAHVSVGDSNIKMHKWIVRVH